MRQKLAVAATMAVDAPLLILDEPTTNLDPTIRGVVLDLVNEARELGRTVLFSSHVLSEVEQVCDRVGFLRGGRLVRTQSMSELKSRHRIRAVLAGPMPPVPASLDGELSIRSDEDGHVLIETPGELSPLLSWLSTLPLERMNVEPIGLRSLYDQLHGGLPEGAEATDE
jgi:ABC-2 type transport system ATP-binding protein